MNIDQPSATVLAAFIAAIPATLLALQSKKTAQPDSPPLDKKGADAQAAASENTTPSKQKSATRLAPSRKPLLFIAWGQLSLLIPQFVSAGDAPISNWSATFIAQGAVMLLLGFWLLLRD